MMRNRPGLFLRFQRVRDRLPLVLLLVAVLIFLVVTGLTLLPGRAIDVTENGGHVFFTADRLLVATPGTCVNLRWEVSDIREIYLNDMGVIGAGESSMCITKETLPSLRVVFQNGVSRTYRLNVGILAANVFMWILGFAALLMAASAAYLTIRRWIGSRFDQVTAAFRKVVKVAAVLVVGTAGLGITVEIGLRLYLTYFGTERERQLYLYSAEEIRQTNTGMIGLPFLNYGLEPGVFQTNQLGYRGREIEIPKPEGVFRIVMLGNSTVMAAGSTSPALELEKLLRQNYGFSKVEVVNGGVGAANTWHNVVNFAFRVLEIEPDLLIVYQGNADVGAALVDPDCYRGINGHRGINPANGVWQKRPEALSPVVLYRYIGLEQDWVPNPLLNPLPLENVVPCAEHKTLTEAEAIKANPPVYFERNLRTLVGIGWAHNVRVMFSSFAYFPEGDQELTPVWLQQAIDDYNAVTKRVAEDMRAPFYDLAANLPYNRDFWQSDGTHYTALGAREQARQYAAFIVEQGLITPD